MAEYSEILVEVADRVATVTLHRPDKLNAWTPAMEAGMHTAFHRSAGDGAVRAIVLAGTGRGFCSGAAPPVIRMAEADTTACRATDGSWEGVAHFIEKRANAFTGR